MRQVVEMPRSLLSRCFGAHKDAAYGALVAVVVVAAIGALGRMAEAYADGLGIKPGLWEVRLVRQVVDGHDVSQQLTESVAKAQTALANLSPEERAHVQSMLKEASASPGNNASFRICIGAEMAANDLPVLEKDNSCRPVSPSRSGHRTTFHVDCVVNGTHIQGQGNAVSAGDVITTQADITTRAADGSMHSMHDETQMQYIGARCGNLRPAH